MPRSAAIIVREYGPWPDVTHVHGVSHDGQRVWIATGEALRALDPASGAEVRRLRVPAQAGEVVVLEPPTEGAHAELLSLLADGQAWSSSALAIALGLSQRSLQRALQELAGQGKARPVGQGRARRWTAEPVPGFPTSLLLPGALIGG